MKHHPPPGATTFARRLRSEPTEAEKKLWRLLRENFPEARFRRQVPIRHYIVDFASHSARLVVEADGGQHDDAADGERTRLIEAEGYRVIRFWNNDILSNADGVATEMAMALTIAFPLNAWVATKAVAGGCSQAVHGLERGALAAKCGADGENTPTNLPHQGGGFDSRQRPLAPPLRGEREGS